MLDTSARISPQNITKELLSQFEALKASDLHIVSKLPPYFRINGTLTPYGSQPLTKGLIEHFLKEITDPDIMGGLLGREEIDLSSKFNLGDTEIRLRINMALSDQLPYAVIRRLEIIRHSPFQLGLPQEFVDLCEHHTHGVIFITGTTGSGKSTTLASTLAWLLQRMPYRVITLEDPIEYLIPTGQGVVTQREIHRDTKDFASALRAAMRQDPNVILVGEVRDTKTAEALLGAAESGHLVFTTLHVGTATDVPNRLGSLFDIQEGRAVKERLYNTLAGVLTQTLVPSRKGRSLGWEFLPVGTEERDLFRNNQFPEIRNRMEKKRFRLADCLIRLVSQGLVDTATAKSYCNYWDEWDEDYLEHFRAQPGLPAQEDSLSSREIVLPSHSSGSSEQTDQHLPASATDFMDDDNLFFP